MTERVIKLLSFFKSNALILLLIFAFIIRVVYSIYAYRSDIMADFNDDQLYHDIATSILDRGIVHYQDGEGLDHLIICPGLPMTLSFFRFLLGDNWVVIFLLNSVFSTLLLYLLYRIGTKLLPKPTLFLAIFWGSIYFLYLKYIPTAGKEIWISLLFISLVWLFIEKFLHQHYPIYYIPLFALNFALLIFFDERYLAYLPFFALFIFIYRDRKARLFPSFLRAFFTCVLVVLLLIPWIYRSYIATGEIWILTPRTTEITDRLLGSQGKRAHQGVVAEIATTRFEISEEKIDSIIADYPDVTDNAGRKIPLQQYDAIQNYGKIPYRYSFMENAWMSARTLWKPIDISYNYTTGGYRFDGKWSFKHNLVSGLFYGILLPFMVLGIIILFLKRNKLSIFLTSILLYHTLIHMLFIPFTRYRYRVPVDFIVIILGSYGMWYILQKIIKVRKSYLVS